MSAADAAQTTVEARFDDRGWLRGPLEGVDVLPARWLGTKTFDRPDGAASYPRLRLGGDELQPTLTYNRTIPAQYRARAPLFRLSLIKSMTPYDTHEMYHTQSSHNAADDLVQWPRCSCAMPACQ